MIPIQYARYDNVLVPVGETVPRLAAGFYELGHANNQYGVTPMRPISDDLIDIPGTPADETMIDIAKFLAEKDRYARCGLTHKRGYLFYGPPGTGKTSIGMMLARRFISEADGIVLHVPSAGHLALLVDIMRQLEPSRPTMFVMEEADAFINDPIALSIIDGEMSLAGAVFVAMTNYKEKMPPRIANRPGRFDRVLYVGAPPFKVQVEYFNRLLTRLGEDHEDAAVRLAEALDGISISMGHLREAFIAHVLMDVPLAEVTNRFEKMAGKTENEGASENDDEKDGEYDASSDNGNDKCTWCDTLLGSDGICLKDDCTA